MLSGQTLDVGSIAAQVEQKARTQIPAKTDQAHVVALGKVAGETADVVQHVFAQVVRSDVAVADPNGQTVSRITTAKALASGSRDGSISGVSSAIGGTTGVTTDADSRDKERHFIVEDSAGVSI